MPNHEVVDTTMLFCRVQRLLEAQQTLAAETEVLRQQLVKNFKALDGDDQWHFHFMNSAKPKYPRIMKGAGKKKSRNLRRRK